MYDTLVRSGGYASSGSSAIEAGDSTFVRAMQPMPAHRIPPAANDNGVAERPRLIGLMGYAGSGKSTVASALIGMGYIHTKFAGPLKAMLRALYGQAGMAAAEIDRRLEGDLKEVPDDLLQGRTPRQAMQWLGTDWGREFFGPEFWVGMWAAGIDESSCYVVDDCRFANEADAIRVRGGVIVEVRRPGVGPLPGGHKSEILPTDPDIVIHNDGTIYDLRQRVNELAA